MLRICPLMSLRRPPLAKACSCALIQTADWRRAKGCRPRRLDMARAGRRDVAHRRAVDDDRRGRHGGTWTVDRHARQESVIVATSSISCCVKLTANGVIVAFIRAPDLKSFNSLKVTAAYSPARRPASGRWRPCYRRRRWQGTRRRSDASKWSQASPNENLRQSYIDP